MCYEGSHSLIQPVALSLLLALLLFPAASFFAVRAVLQARLGDASVVGLEVAEEWRSVGAHWLPLPTLAKLQQLGQLGQQPGQQLGQQLGQQHMSQIPAQTALTVAEMEAAEAAEASAAAAAAALCKAQAEAHAVLAVRAAALLDASPRAHAAPTALLLHPWTVGDRRPSRFYFSQLEQLVLFLLTLATAFNAGSQRDPGSGATVLPYVQALALQVVLLVLTLACMAAQAYATLRLGQFREADFWKRDALVAVLALTAMAAMLNFVAWMGGAGGLVVALAVSLFAGTVLLFLFLLRSFFSALEASCKAEAAASRGKLQPAGTGAGTVGERVFSVRNPMLERAGERAARGSVYPVGRQRAGPGRAHRGARVGAVGDLAGALALRQVMDVAAKQ